MPTFKFGEKIQYRVQPNQPWKQGVYIAPDIKKMWERKRVTVNGRSKMVRVKNERYIGNKIEYGVEKERLISQDRPNASQNMFSGWFLGDIPNAQPETAFLAEIQYSVVGSRLVTSLSGIKDQVNDSDDHMTISLDDLTDPLPFLDIRNDEDGVGSSRSSLVMTAQQQDNEDLGHQRCDWAYMEVQRVYGNKKYVLNIFWDQSQQVQGVVHGYVFSHWMDQLPGVGWEWENRLPRGWRSWRSWMDSMR
ncbi:hypothetical protein BYT27DRAFT_7240199 [Phlegmacium glaucopus]|nr:hypothetical protein BYT27DRAFT_7240199 [Phlegmacium glaucopus]